MREELGDKLCRDFPVLFKDRHEPVRVSSMNFGFQCGDGWYDILYQACKDIVKADPNAIATTVKEKFGQLRVYLRGNGKAYEIADKLEDESAEVCEGCGSKEGVIQTTGWIVTLCPRCLDEYRKRHEEWGGGYVKHN